MARFWVCSTEPTACVRGVFQVSRQFLDSILLILFFVLRPLGILFGLMSLCPSFQVSKTCLSAWYWYIFLQYYLPDFRCSVSSFESLSGFSPPSCPLFAWFLLIFQPFWPDILTLESVISRYLWYKCSL